MDRSSRPSSIRSIGFEAGSLLTPSDLLDWIWSRLSVHRPPPSSQLGNGQSDAAFFCILSLIIKERGPHLNPNRNPVQANRWIGF